MNTEDIIQQLIGGIVENPDMLTSLMEHPYSTVRGVTGEEEASREEVSEVITGISELAAGQTIDFGNLSQLASGLLSENNGSAHELANSLFGADFAGGINILEGISPDMISNLAGVVFGGGTAENKSAIDLSDGLGIDDIMGLAGMILDVSK